MLNRFSRFVLAMAEIQRCWHKLTAEEMARYDLNGSHAVYLNTLWKHPEGITASQLGQLCGKNKADVSRMVSILEQKGLVQRENTGGNSYRARLLLTQTGKAAAECVRQRTALAVALASEGVTDSERETFYRALEKITANLQKLSQEGLPEANTVREQDREDV